MPNNRRKKKTNNSMMNSWKKRYEDAAAKGGTDSPSAAVGTSSTSTAVAGGDAHNNHHQDRSSNSSTPSSDIVHDNDNVDVDEQEQQTAAYALPARLSPSISSVESPDYMDQILSPSEDEHEEDDDDDDDDSDNNSNINNNNLRRGFSDDFLEHQDNTHDNNVKGDDDRLERLRAAVAGTAGTPPSATNGGDGTAFPTTFDTDTSNGNDVDVDSSLTPAAVAEALDFYGSLSASTGSGNCSADSIIRRVEEEIAAAKKAAQSARVRLHSSNSEEQDATSPGGGTSPGTSSNPSNTKNIASGEEQQVADRRSSTDDDDDDDFDMEAILDTTSSLSHNHRHPPRGSVATTIPEEKEPHSSSAAEEVEAEGVLLVPGYDIVASSSSPSSSHQQHQHGKERQRAVSEEAEAVLVVPGYDLAQANGTTGALAIAIATATTPIASNQSLLLLQEKNRNYESVESSKRTTPTSLADKTKSAESFFDCDEWETLPPGDAALAKQQQQAKVKPSKSVAFADTSTTDAEQQQPLSPDSSPNRQSRARQLLDTLKERRESFTTTFEMISPRNGDGDDSAFTFPSEDSPSSPRLPDSLQLDLKGESPRNHILYGNNSKSRSSDVEDEQEPNATSETVHHKLKRVGNSAIQAVLEINASASEEKKEDDISVASSSAAGQHQQLLQPPSDKPPTPSRTKGAAQGGMILISPNNSKKKQRSNSSDDGGTPKSDRNKTASTAATTTGQVDDAFCRKSRRIRFRDPFPVLKPANRPRDAASIIQSHSVATPSIKIRWLRPKNDLRQLIVAVMGSSLQRRSNACGALKVLTRQKKNQLTLLRTDSFLEAIVFAASQDIPELEKDLALDARTRAVACLKNCCEPKDNRVFAITYPGFKDCLLKVIRSDNGEARVLACGAFALLAKTAECREPMAHTDGLLNVLAEAMSGAIDEKKNDVGDCKLNANSDMSSSAIDVALSNMSQLTKDSALTGRDDDASDASDNSSEYSSSSFESEEEHVVDDESRDLNMIQTNSIRQVKEEMQGEFEQRARSNACAALLHLSKHCSVSHTLCSNTCLLNNLIVVAKDYDSVIHTKCLEILCNLTRFPSNTGVMTRYENLVDTLVAAADSGLSEDRISALRGLQNLSADSSKSLLASETVLNSMTSCALREDAQEKEAAVAFLYNVSTEPGAVVSITNTKNVVATFVHLAHHPESPSNIRLMACDALATISLWLQTLAGTGKVPKDVVNVPLPSQKTSGWDRWE